MNLFFGRIPMQGVSTVVNDISKIWLLTKDPVGANWAVKWCCFKNQNFRLPKTILTATNDIST